MLAKFYIGFTLNYFGFPIPCKSLSPRPPLLPLQLNTLLWKEDIWGGKSQRFYVSMFVEKGM